MNIEITRNKDWNLTIDLNGGRIRELKYKDEIILGTYERIDGKEGNTHICCPNFGSEGEKKFNLPFHGPFRSLDWTLIDKNKNEIIIERDYLGLKIRQRFTLTNIFEQLIEIWNWDGKEKPLNLAIHNYWDSVNGWEGIKLNGEAVDDLVKADASKVLLRENIIEIPNKPKYKWTLNGFKYGQFWTAFKEVNKKKKYDESYVCIEPSLEKQGFLDKGLINLSKVDCLTAKQMIEVVN